MAEFLTHDYIPAGCLLIDRDQHPLLSRTPDLINDQQWYFFTRKSDNLAVALRLPTELQNILLGTPTLVSFTTLWAQGWIQLAYATHPVSISPQCHGRVRVYVLPHDVNRGTHSPRSELTRMMPTLLRHLEYSQECWQGKNVYPPLTHPTHTGPGMSSGCDSSLLTLFNNIPSPDPHPEKASDTDLRWAMQCLLESHIPGLVTTLYPYQGRSAALMLQREIEPGRVIDPRLRPVLDQSGQPWYYDEVSGLVLKEPRFYDGARGGILAEEMGTGKTLICLALILSTKSEPSKPPDPFIAETSPRHRIGSLMDMAAAAARYASISAIPWKPYFEACAAQLGYEYRNCIEALTRPENRALYKVRNTMVEPRRSNRLAPREIPSREVFLSHLTLVIVPTNLVKQWQNEINKHTTGLSVLVVVNQDPIPPVADLLPYDVILFSESRFERIHKERLTGEGPLLNIYCPLEDIRFKRCIIDEGHKLGNGSRAWKNDVMRVVERLEISSYWVVTGTPSRGLYGLQSQNHTEVSTNAIAQKQEQEDLQRIGNLAAKYLKVRPWANGKNEAGDSVADWATYVKGHDRKDCLINTLNSLVVRHRLNDVNALLPPVDEKVIVLDGSFQDQLSLNLFSMMIIFNSVQSQRTDMDYFFHERQRKSLAQLVKNLRQASFFGGVFFSVEDIAKAVTTAEEFLEKKAVPISSQDDNLLCQAIEFGKKAAQNRLKDVSNRFHSMPIYVQDFPGGRGKSWSLDDEENEEGLVCTDAGLILSLQNFLNPCIDAPTSLQLMIDRGSLDQQGMCERSQALAAASDAGEGISSRTTQTTAVLAGNTPLGGDYHTTLKSKKFEDITAGDLQQHLQESANPPGNFEVAKPLAKTRIISTVSAKLSYLIDQIIKHQDNEQILIFYDNDNVAFYLASVLEILQIQHLIYSRVGLSAERRAQYVATFTNSPNFRVLLMDISQAAFGLDMRSASRIYFISPVLNPQIVAQAIGRARRISQQKPVSVETLVLRNSIEEIMMDRREHMTQAEHTRIKNVLDDRKIKEWIRNPKIYPMADVQDGLAQTALLSSPQYVFGRGFGRASLDPDEGLITTSPVAEITTTSPTKYQDGDAAIPFQINRGIKRALSPHRTEFTNTKPSNGVAVPERPIKVRARVAWVDQEV
ncbi:SNF2 family N-terminal domain-containing protein [Xylaria bambusicola]|uniref:SNF2 family N-terminal domain-containing protein n=1 Tax=Xylaria bambusicola TaxID=326684 RepID=UPI002008E0BD|nr:SNF2 family N-terminal domain-containing protein [Xylaria bambusicola]KAI0526028.1 SNF2 family N-terminal domain-containing protein [Xylaria bambusicola]